MTSTVTPLAQGRRVPIPYPNEDGIPCLRVPLDDTGKTFALIERSDYVHIVETLGCRASWYHGGTRGRRKYVRVNAPYAGGQAGGNFLVVSLFPGVGPEHRVRYATPDTLDLRRRNLIVEAIQDGRNLAGGSLMAEAVQRRDAAQRHEVAEKRRLRGQRTRRYIRED